MGSIIKSNKTPQIYEMKSNKRVILILEEISNFLDKSHDVHNEDLNEIEKDLLLIKDKLNKMEELDLKKKEKIYIWSDGACKGNPGPGGWASVIQMNGEKTEISGGSQNTTNNIMELTAALEGIRKTPTGSNVIVTTDSQYLINGISNWVRNWKQNSWRKKDGKPVLNQELWQELDAECQLRNVDWKWIKGHSGHPINERCDRLAKQAIKTQQN